MSRKLLTPEEYDEIRRSRSFARAMEALAVYVRKPTGPEPTGQAMTGAERLRRWRAAKKET